MKRLSIGVRLMLWYVAVFALGELVFGATMFFVLRSNLYDLVDDGAENQIEDLKNFLQAQKKDAPPAELRYEMTRAYSMEHSGDFLAVYLDTGEPLYKSAFLQAHESVLVPVGRVNRRSYRSRRVGNQPFRFIYQKLTANDRVYVVEMGVPADDAVDTLHEFRSYLLMFAPLLLLVAAGVGYWMSRKALAPVDQLVQTARVVGGANLSSRLPKLNTGDELQRLSDTLNEMLERIESAFLRVTEFTADASHELRTPVSLIRTEAELALRRSRGEAEYRESLQHVLSEAERTTKLIEQLLELARADSGREILEIKPVHLDEALRGIFQGWKQVSTVREIQFTADIRAGSTFIMGDETMLRRVVDILLDNAFKYTPSHGSVQLALEQNAQNAVITVQDSGVGISEEDQSKIFERFYRVDKARSRSQGGTGLGLSIAQWIVTQHRGTITVTSRASEGATFRIELPMIAAPVENTQPV
ncbi:MAG TPA: ATP-binding protein [Candidatus Sulfotelmatobacter sp.]|nr:ATP-binding protein [Candidatus Sulfotelmatobacter sp.]